MQTLRGLTWAHSRGVVPLVAASEAWHDLYPDTAIHWDRRSFWGFGEGPLDEVARDYDLIVFDHPHTGSAAARGLLLPLDELANSDSLYVGPSRRSYVFESRLYGVPIDAACQSAAYRADLMEQAGESLPLNWSDVVALASRTGRVACCFSPMGALGMLHSLTAALGEPAGSSAEFYFAREPGLEALDRLVQLFRACPVASLEESPVRILGRMATTDQLLYAPLLYCYSNYARCGFAPHPVRFVPPPIHPEGAGAVLGGAGLGVSAFSRQRDAAFAFARWLTSPCCQENTYLHAQGQPALRSVWSSPAANTVTNGFYASLLPTIDRASLRSNRPGFAHFQSCAAAAVHQFLRSGNAAAETLSSIDRLWSSSCSV